MITLELNMGIVKLNQYRVFLTNDLWVDVYAECPDDALQLGLDTFLQEHPEVPRRKYLVWTPLSDTVDYMDKKIPSGIPVAD